MALSIKRFSRALLSVGAVLLILPSIAPAHSVVIESSPRDGARLATPPKEIVLRFNAKIEKPLTRLKLVTGDGRPVPLPAMAQEGNGERTGGRLVIPLPPLAPGSYALRYKILSTDGHATPGILRFSVTGGP